MNSSLCISSSSHPTLPHFSAPKWRIHHHNPRNHHRPIHPTISCSFSRRRPRSRRRLNPNTFPQSEPSSPSNSKVQMVIDIEQLSNEASLSINSFLTSSELKFDQFVKSGNEAFEDLQTLITFDPDRNVMISCRRSTLQFVGNLVLWGCVIVFAFRVLVKLGLGFRDRLGFGYGGGVIRRRDRSLGGREVVVARKKNRMTDFSVSTNPLSPVRGTLSRVSDAMPRSWVRTKEKKLPHWWPVSLLPPVLTIHKEEYQKEANRLIRAIMDNRMSGQDILEDDIIQLRQICRTSGVRVFIDTTNARDSFYRASVDFVLNKCSSAASHSIIFQIDGEDARQFIAGLADNLGLESIRAARIVSAAVAARTRSYFLQAWALEMQDKHSEAVAELSKICLIHHTFPPEEGSPEMEMVARGLEKHLKVEQREFLMNMLIRICDEENHRSLAEAMGLAKRNKCPMILDTQARKC
ncbi:hypothetical protein F0562_006074 [Nyssa sinensis]|uniref:Uncharacterized protein n=1 Tax=Nyssa sinensis TaxID=561372 RepID=A0A5J5AJW7_9ASTE|nr:hypothetical protein F0562_006074 [Nyssa sinensis]